MVNYIERSGLSVEENFVRFIEDEVLCGIDFLPVDFWAGLRRISDDFMLRNQALLKERTVFQEKQDAWFRENRAHFDPAAYESFLRSIGYIAPEGPTFQIETEGCDEEVGQVAGPQLVVPVSNARYTLSAANGRWGSLYDAFYGTDALGDAPTGGGYDRARGLRVVAAAKAHLDAVVPIEGARWNEIVSIGFAEGLILKSSSAVHSLKDEKQFVGYTRNDAGVLSSAIFKKNGLHIRVLCDPEHLVGKDDPAHISDIVLESAVSVIMDAEDSAATIDAEDRIEAYRNWLGLMKGDLSCSLTKEGRSFTRRLADDIDYLLPNGKQGVLRGRALMMMRNAGHLMTTSAVLSPEGCQLGEGLIDALCTVVIALHDLKKMGAGNSRTGSVYVVKPKMHGVDEATFTDELFACVEDILGLERNTVKIGLMDEERRTSVNLKECIRTLKGRIAFVNTGFLDRTGDEIHSSMEAGPFLKKSDIKQAPWYQAYENRSVDIGLQCGFQGRAQIGKGMWAIPDMMQKLLETKSEHPEAGANCAWVPSPTAATLHALHYHKTDVFARQDALMEQGERSTLKELLTIPLAKGQNLSDEEIAYEIDTNVQSILGYVVRWVDQGIGCSRVPDLQNVGLMEDRATCRISSQSLANWLHHGVITRDQLMTSLKKMAVLVDQQNAGDPAYNPMAPNFNGAAFKTACQLIFDGVIQENGYTEPLLYAGRAEVKKNEADKL